ncbi:MAG: hypothetical protein CM15mP103_09620 [Gammaproteobacteria bacterium]|nr:MAG: hypothetical protein CM15mP103_09620 [Gammaproteobacteria bacterium]
MRRWHAPPGFQLTNICRDVGEDARARLMGGDLCGEPGGSFMFWEPPPKGPIYPFY